MSEKADLEETVEDLVKSASELPATNRARLITRWDEKAKYHKSQARSFEKRAMFTRRDQENLLSKTYQLVVERLRALPPE